MRYLTPTLTGLAFYTRELMDLSYGFLLFPYIKSSDWLGIHDFIGFGSLSRKICHRGFMWRGEKRLERYVRTSLWKTLQGALLQLL